RRMPAVSGTVSMSKASSGTIAMRDRASARLPRSRREHAGRQIAIAAIADDEDDRCVLDALRDAKRDRAGATRADAAEDAFFAGEATRGVLGVPLRDVLGAIDALRIEDFRQISRRPFADAGNGRALLRLRTDHLDRRVLLLQETRHAHDRARGAHCRDEVRDAALRVAP